jgi:hypothetical protein
MGVPWARAVLRATKADGVKRGRRQPENLFGIYDFWFWHAMILCWNLCASNFNDFHLPEINGKYDNSANCDSLDGITHAE